MVAAVDIGGTRLRAALVDGAGRVARRLAEPVRAPADGAALTAQLVASVRRLLEHDPASDPAAAARGSVEAPGEAVEVAAVGVSLPAVIDRASGRVEWAPNLPGWSGTPLRDRLVEALGVPVALEYDGHAAVLGEHWVGAGRGVDDLACVIVGTGVGGGFVAGGRLVRGACNLAGAGGWMGVPPCGEWDAEAAAQRGLLESLIAGPSLQARAARRLGEALPPRVIFDRASQGDPDCRAIVDEAVEHLGWALVNVVSLLNPELVLLGGSVGLRLAEHASRLAEAVRRFAQPWSARRVRIEPAGLGDDAGLLGAARSALLAADAESLQGSDAAAAI